MPFTVADRVDDCEAFEYNPGEDGGELVGSGLLIPRP